jgi:hypothetical protein
MRFLVVTSLLLSGCAISHHRGGQNDSTEVSLKSDLTEVERNRSELRKDIPVVTQGQNDDLAVILNLMKDDNLPPQSIRTRYLRHVEKVRRDFRKQTDDLRSQFNKAEKDNRKEFLDDLAEEKDDFKKDIAGEKYDREKSKEFYAKIEYKRKEYFDNERDRRKDFESNMKQLRDDFSSRMRDWQLQFNDSIKIYEQRLKEKNSNKTSNSGGFAVPENQQQQSLEAGQ